MKKLHAIVAVLAFASFSFGQVAGGAGAYGQQRQSGADAARAIEIAKRNARDDGKYLDADILMNVNADEYVAVFGIGQEGKTLDEARAKVDAAAKAFSDSLKGLKVAPADVYVDFIAQNRIYGFEGAGTDVAKEVVVGFEVKKNISVHYKDKAMLDSLTAAASRAGIFDLIKVDYIVKDTAAIRARMMQEAVRIIKAKEAEQEQLLGIKSGQITHVYPAQLSTYFPTEMYDGYQAQESEELGGYRNNQNIQRARKPKTFYFNGLTGKDFDLVINPVIIEPTVQFTLYLRVKY